MNKLSHLLVTKAVLSKYTVLDRRQKMLVLAGSVLPDILLHTYIKSHTWQARSAEVFEAIRKHHNTCKHHGMMLMRYGCMLHYIEDFFTWAHNETFHGTLQEHAGYEIRLYRHLLSRKNEPMRAEELCAQNAGQLISQLRALHEEYMDRTPAPENDRHYIFQAAGMAADFLLVKREMGRAGSAA